MFKEQCLTVLDHLDPDGIIITKHGKPVAKLIPLADKNVELIGCLKGTLHIRGNILTTRIKWHAES